MKCPHCGEEIVGNGSGVKERIIAALGTHGQMTARQLADIAWPENPPFDPLATVRVHIAQLNRERRVIEHIGNGRNGTGYRLL